MRTAPRSLAGRSAIVTGSTSGIGLGIAQALAAEGADVVLNGADIVVPTYSMMGPVKAALEACCRDLAYELGPMGIRVHAISPGPLNTRAASGIKDFGLLLNEAEHRAPLGELVDIMNVGYLCGFLSTVCAPHVGRDALRRRVVNIMACAGCAGAASPIRCA